MIKKTGEPVKSKSPCSQRKRLERNFIYIKIFSRRFLGVSCLLTFWGGLIFSIHK